MQEQGMHPENAAEILLGVLLDSPTTKSDAARWFASELAELASRGLITTYIPGIGYGNRWIVTPAGRHFLEFHAPRHVEHATETNVFKTCGGGGDDHGGVQNQG